MFPVSISKPNTLFALSSSSSINDISLLSTNSIPFSSPDDINVTINVEFEFVSPVSGSSYVPKVANFDAVKENLDYVNKFRGKKVVITSGGTIEDIDPVRYISNYSSGKMGKALADMAYNMCADVVLITTKECECPYKTVKVKSAVDMQNALNEEFDSADYIIMAAAVADYRVKSYSSEKLKKTSEDEISLTLIKNPDILRELCERRRMLSSSDVKIIGFCA